LLDIGGPKVQPSPVAYGGSFAKETYNCKEPTTHFNEKDTAGDSVFIGKRILREQHGKWRWRV